MFPTAFKNWADHLVPGESRLAVILAHDRRQARVIFKYASVLLQTPLLCGLVEQERDEAIDLTNGLSIEIMAASFRAVRGYTLVAALCDESHFGEPRVILSTLTLKF